MPAIDSEKLSAVFDIDSKAMSHQEPIDFIDSKVESSENLPVVKTEVVPNKIFERSGSISQKSLDNALDNSIEYVLTTQSELIGKASKLVDYALENANCGTARDIETASETINAAVNAAEKLIDIQKKIKELKAEEKVDNNPQLYQQNNIQIFGSTNEAIKKIREGFNEC